MKPHETDITPPLAENPSSHRQGIHPPRPSDPGGARRLAPTTAKQPFQADHQATFGTPSGELTWDIKVSKKPYEWFYSAAETPGESFGLPAPNASHRKTNAHIAACISWHWAEEVKRWQQPIAQTVGRMIALGAVSITKLPEPAEEGWIIHLVAGASGRTYVGQFRKMICLFLGNHWILAPLHPKDHSAAAAALIDKIRQASINKMHPPVVPILNHWDRSFQPWNIKL